MGVYTRHQRSLSYIDDTVRTLANIVDRFRPGSVYNIAGLELYEMKHVSDLVLRQLGKTDRLVTYKELEPATTLVKKVDASRAVAEIDHRPTVDLEEGLRRTVSWYLSHLEWLERVRSGAYRDYLQRQYGTAVV